VAEESVRSDLADDLPMEEIIRRGARAIVVIALIPLMTVPKQKRDPDVWLDHEDVRGLVRRLRETWEVFTGNETNRNSQTASRPTKNTPTPR
jgi:predicted patatin/cPLA2 family phospholipase